MNPNHVLILDTWSGAKPAYADAFDHVETRRVDMGFAIGENGHPHGAQVAWCWLSQIPRERKKIVAYGQIFDERMHAVGLDKVEGWVDYAERERPDCINLSVGAHANNERERAFLEKAMAPLSEVLFHLADLGIQIFIAAGNSDTYSGSGRRRRFDLDDDVNWPARSTWHHNNIHVIGACDGAGTPAWFSSDAFLGEERLEPIVLGMYFGHMVQIPHPETYRPEFASGTSFASPFAAGDYCARDFGSGQDYVADFIARADRWPAWVARHGLFVAHPKAGFGSGLRFMRENAEQATEVYGAPRDVVTPMWMEFERVGGGE